LSDRQCRAESRGGPPALAAPKDPSHDKVLIANQAVLDEFSSSIEKNPGLVQAGYIASFHDVENRALELKWHNMAANVQAMLTAQAAQLGVKLSVLPSKFSRDERGRAHAAVQSQAEALRSLGYEMVGLSDANREDDGFIALVRQSRGPGLRTGCNNLCGTTHPKDRRKLCEIGNPHT
jgi:hypothetical protein